MPVYFSGELACNREQRDDDDDDDEGRLRHDEARRGEAVSRFFYLEFPRGNSMGQRGGRWNARVSVALTRNVCRGLRGGELRGAAIFETYDHRGEFIVVRKRRNVRWIFQPGRQKLEIPYGFLMARDSLWRCVCYYHCCH